MLAYIVRRLLIMIPTLILVSILSFIALQLPPGDYLTSYAAQLSTQGEYIDQESLDSLR
jgi:peptide/nickel transport system permease protein